LQRQRLLVALRNLVRGDEGDPRSVRTPRELLYALRRVGEPPRIAAAAERQNPDLPLRIFVIREKRDPRAVRRPPRRGDAAAIERQRTPRAGGDVDRHNLGVVAILL